MIVTAHQSNYLPGMNVIDKVRQSDAVIWLDECQFTHGGYTNRNKMPDGSWLTVPVGHTGPTPINRVRVSSHGAWRRKHGRALLQHYGPAALPLTEEIHRPYGLLVGLNLALLRIILADCPTLWAFQSHLDGGHAVQAVSDERAVLAPISERLAMMVAELGGTTYLSGPSGFRYLDEVPFLERGIRVDYYEHRGSYDCSASRLRTGGFYLGRPRAA